MNKSIEWTSCTEAKPDHGQKVLASYINQLGNQRVVIAIYAQPFRIYAYADDMDGCVEYSDVHDDYFLKEGWYECVDNWDEFSFIGIHQGEVDQWTPLLFPRSPSEKQA